MPTSTKEILNKYNISRQTLHNWTSEFGLLIPRNIRGNYIWNEESIKTLDDFVEKRKDINYRHEYSHNMTDTFELNNRRYLGAKTKILHFINDVISSKDNEIKSVADIFGGTGVVANMFYSQGKDIIVNDILQSNFVIYDAFFGSLQVRDDIIFKYIKNMNELPLKENYISENYGQKYFSLDNAMKIGEAREYIETITEINSREKNILLTSLLFAVDKVANTVGHYDAYRKKLDNNAPILFRIPNYHKDMKSTKAEIFSMDANELVRKIKTDLVYIDTPYNSRQYGDIYHVLENIITWEKPDLFGVAAKPKDRSKTKSRYSTSKAPIAFNDLISNISAKYVLVSYNNMAKKGNSRSNAKIDNDDIINILSKRGKVEVFDINYKPFSSGKSDIKDHKELLYLLTIDNNKEVQYD